MKILSWLSKRPFVKELKIRKLSALGKSRGRVVVRHRARSVFCHIHLLDRFRLIWNLPGLVISLEKNKLAGGYVALLAYPIGILAYVTAVAGQTIGDTVMYGWSVPCRIGNAMPLKNIPLNIKINSIESLPGSGSVFVRSPGGWAVIVSKDLYYAKVMLKGGRVKFFNLNCLATIGRVSNLRWANISWKKAGDSRKFGRRPTVRGVAKNPVDHPHGGGKGKKSKNAVPEAPWGRLGARKKKK